MVSKEGWLTSRGGPKLRKDLSLLPEIMLIDHLDDIWDLSHAPPHHIIPQNGFLDYCEINSTKRKDVDFIKPDNVSKKSKLVGLPKLDTVSEEILNTPRTSCAGTCLSCNGYFQRLDRHMLTHSGERPFACTECPERFRQRIHLKRHMERHERVSSHPCLYCGKVLTRKDKLEHHMKQTCKVLREY
ncbi:hypothetical protein FOCC_FOCC000282 [Frankliniella occidentalis]|nr:hypothetical protein FOCC_FOCC000282 [Frankliniella occidentalis]